MGVVEVTFFVATRKLQLISWTTVFFFSLESLITIITWS